jgi:hypothetical protein
MSEQVASPANEPLGPTPPADSTPSVLGIRFFRDVVVVVGILAFVGIYIVFLVRIVDARGSGQQADIDNQITYAASSLGGVLSAYFAFILGVARDRPSDDGGRGEVENGDDLPPDRPAMGRLVSEDAGSMVFRTPTAITWIGTLAFYAYTLIGVLTFVWSLIFTVETPDIIKGTSSAFLGTILAVFSSQFAYRTKFNAGSLPSRTTAGSDGQT